MLPICWFNFASLKWIKLIGLVYGMPLAPVRLWSSCGAFLFLIVLCPSGTHEILGTKVGSPGTTPRNAVAVGREFCRQPSAFCLQNGYSRKIPDQFLGSWPLTWLPRRRAKNCLYPKGRSIKKLHTKETDNIKECLTTLGWTISFTTSFTKTAADGIQKGTIIYGRENK